MGHHYVPQRYLRNFESPERPKWIWLHDKRDLVSKLVSIKTVAQAKQFYTAEDEKRLNLEVEIPGNAVIQKLRVGQVVNGHLIDPLERVQLAYYIATMIKRVPFRRREFAKLIPEALETAVVSVRADLNRLAEEMKVSPDLVAKRILQVDAYHERCLREPPQTVLDQIRAPWPTERVVATIFNMTWRIMKPQGLQKFITCDNPAFYFDSYGIGSPKSELVFPLATDLLLHGSWDGQPAGLYLADAPEKMVREFNRRLVSTTERLAFYHREATWLLKILPKENHYLSVIQWRKQHVQR